MSSGSINTKATTIPTLWDMLSEQQRSPLENSWMQSLDGMPMGIMPAPTQQIVEQLRQAVAKGAFVVLVVLLPDLQL